MSLIQFQACNPLLLHLNKRNFIQFVRFGQKIQNTFFKKSTKKNKVQHSSTLLPLNEMFSPPLPLKFVCWGLFSVLNNPWIFLIFKNGSKLKQSKISKTLQT